MQNGWDLAPDARPTDELVLLSKWLSSQKVDAGGGLIQLDTGAMKALQQELRKNYGELFTVDTRVSAAWQLALADRAEASQDWFATSFHLRRLMERTDGKEDNSIVSLGVRLGNAQAQMGKWKSAAENYARVAKLAKADEKLLIALALSHRASGDVKAFEAAALKLVEQAGDSTFGTSAARLAWISLLEPGEALRKNTAELIGHIGNEQIDEIALAVIRGANLYRAGEIESAYAMLNDAAAICEELDIPRCCLFLGLCECRRGNLPEAERWLKSATRWRQKMAKP